MADKIEPIRGKVPLNQFLVDFRSHLTDHEVREKYDLSAKAFVSLIKALLAKNVITPADLEKRKVMAVQRDLAKESEFLSTLYICPNCSHPHPQPFERCPACGADPADFVPRHDIVDPLSTSGRHFYIEEHDIESGDEAVPSDSSSKVEVHVYGDKNEHPPTEEIRPEDLAEDYPPTEEIRIEQQPAVKPKKSATDQLRSFLSRIKKK